MKKVSRMTTGNVVVKRSTIFFPTPEDPDGLKHVAQKFLEAEAGMNLLVTAIARAGLSIDSLDLPGASALLKDHAEKNGLPSYPGPTVIAAVVGSIQGAREYLEGQEAEAKGDSTIITPPGLRLVRATEGAEA